MKFTFNPKLFNPLYWHIMPLLSDIKIRYIFVEGGSSAAKTFSIAQAIIIYILTSGKNALVFRRFHVHIKDSVYATFLAALKSLELTEYFIIQDDLIKSKLNGAKIVFKGLDNEENIKGIEDFDIVYNNEWNQFLEDHWKQQRKRLRGRPNQKFISDWNPVSAKLWQYEKWIDLEEWNDLPLTIDAPTSYSSLNADYAFKKVNHTGNSINIKVTYRDNYWIIGHPSGKGGFYDIETIRDFELDRERDPGQYRVYANGERGVLRTGGEFWQQFKTDKHVRSLNYRGGEISISLDDNASPYVTISIWQVVGKQVEQFHELPCKEPDNNAPKAARKFISWLNSIKFENILYVYGDSTSKKRSTVDELSRSFFEKFMEELQKAGIKFKNKVATANPDVALSAAFINDVYEFNTAGWSIFISDRCTVSIEDYEVVKEAPDHTMLKPKAKHPLTGKPYETHGHFSDAKRYFLIELMKEDFLKWKSRKSNLSVQRAYFR
jgi:phage terminase large subunit